MSDFAIKGSSFQPVNVSKIPEGKTELFKDEAKKDGADNVFVKLDNGDEFVATGVANLMSKPVKVGTEVTVNGQKGIVSFVDNEANVDDEKTIQKAKNVAKTLASPKIHGLALLGGVCIGNITYIGTKNIKAAAIAASAITLAAETVAVSGAFHNTNNKKNPDTKALDVLSKASPETLKDIEKENFYEKLLNEKFGETNETKESVKIIKESIKNSGEIGDATKAYVDLLNANRGSFIHTDEAYQEIDSRIRPNETRAEVAQTYINLLNAERGSSSNALADFRLIDSRLSTNEKREFATNIFIKLLSAERGNSAQARDAYKISTK